MSKELYVLKQPVEYGKLVVTEITIDKTPKGKYWRLAQKPMAVKAEMGDEKQEVTTYVTRGAAQITLMQAMTGQPQEILDELGIEDFDYLYGCADEMLGNFEKAQHLPKLAG